ncbi:MAG: prephenate dehydrogenase [Thermodesulfovibrionales bacterium]|nr:prephenate dehydrogenase [Thermodesulfovibrionales bacterium]
MIKYQQVTIVGVGLIGASLSYALKQINCVSKIIGYGRNEQNLIYAKDEGLIDSYYLDLKRACSQSDLIILSTPVGTFLDIIKEIRSDIQKDCIITDAGSVKGKLVYDIEDLMPSGVSFVGSHPIAGSHKSGAIHYEKKLFSNSLCIITPTCNTNQQALEKIIDLWKAIGCRIELLDPYVHDEIYNLVSHMPHLLSYCLVRTVFDAKAEALNFAGKGFKDMTRLAESSPEIWRDIIFYNKDNVIKSLELLKNQLNTVETMINQNNISALEDYFKSVKRCK